MNNKLLNAKLFHFENILQITGLTVSTMASQTSLPVVFYLVNVLETASVAPEVKTMQFPYIPQIIILSFFWFRLGRDTDLISEKFCSFQSISRWTKARNQIRRNITIISMHFNNISTNVLISECNYLETSNIFAQF
jgi:hypothetical protein